MKGSAATRKLAMRAVGPLYRRLGSDFSGCWYCGAPRQCYDHAPPLSWAIGADIGKARENGIELWLVPSCLNRNGDLGAKKLLTPHERLAWLYSHAARSVGVAVERWDEEEASELGYTLRVMVDARERKRNAAILRLRAIEERLLAVTAGEGAA
jgi:hypothetical protein